MKLFNFKKKKSGKKDFKKMSKKEKKEYLSNDFIERMVRIEQRAFSSFGEYVPYKKTKYYDSLTIDEKKGFENYIKKGRNKTQLFSFLFLLFLISFVFIKAEFTGNAVNNFVGEQNYSLVSGSLFWIFLFLSFIAILSFIFKRLKKRRFEKHFKILDEFALREKYNIVKSKKK